MMEHFEKYKADKSYPEGIYDVVSVGRLEDMTRNGWRLVCLVETFEIVELRDPLPPTPASITNQWDIQTWAERQKSAYVHQETVRCVKALVFRDEASALAMQAADLTATRNERERFRNEATEQQRTAAAAAEKVLELEKRAERLEKQFSEEADRGIALRDKNRKLESAIGRLREQLGAQKMKEILGDG